MALDADDLELMERRLTEKVEAQVRERLFRSYGMIWGAVTAVLAVLGVSVVTWVYANANGWAVAAVQTQVDKVATDLTEAQGMIASVEAYLELSTQFLNRREVDMASGDQRRIENEARIKAQTDEFERRLTDLAAGFADADAAVATLKAKAIETAGLGNFEDLRTRLDTVTTQVLHLNRALQQVGGTEGGILEAVDVSALEAGLERPDPPAADAVPPQGLVYLQFAGVPREVADRLAREIEAKGGYDVPGEERIDLAAGKHEVRYFFEADAPRAAALARVANEVLAEAGFRAEVTAADQTGFAGRKPREGVLELWLEPVPAP